MQRGRAPRITEAGAAYVELRCKGYKTFKPKEQVNPAAGASWDKSSKGNVQSTIQLMARTLGDKPFDRISDGDLTKAWEVIARLPNTYQAKTSKLSPQEAAAEADEREARNAELTRARLEKEGASPGKIDARIAMGRIPRMRAATVYRHMQDFQRICRYLVATGAVSDNLMEGHIWDKLEVQRRQILEEDNERLTWCGHLDALFRTPIFRQPLEDPGDPMFWAPLIALHAGLRSEEALQLALRDIQVVDGVPCFVLSQGPGQTLKSPAARRTVPVHRNLIELGFMVLVERLRKNGELRLFPYLERSANKKTYTENFSKRFTAYRRKHGLYDPQRDFHSFRTTFNVKLIETECLDSQRRYIVGHTDTDVGIRHYAPTGFSKALLQKRVDAVEIDITAIRRPFGPEAGRSSGRAEELGLRIV